MWRKLKRWSAMLLAAFLVFTSVQYTGLIAEAENSTTLDYISESTMCSVGESADGVEFSFDANYQELKFSLGQTVDATKIVSAKFDITGLTAGQKLALKLYDASGNEVGVKYDLSENFELAAADITGTAEVSAIGIMANVDGANGSAVFSGVDFKIQSGTEVVKSYKALDGVVALALNYQYGGVSYTGTSDGKLVITSQYAGQQLQMKPVSGLNIDDYKSITYNVSEINGSYTFAVSSWGGTYFTSEAKSEAGAHTFDISGNTGELNLFVFDNPADAGSMTVDSIVLTKNDDTTVTLTMPQEGYTVGNTQGTTSVTNGALTTTLGAGYNSTFITMPAAIAATDCDTVTINVSAVTGGVIIRPVDQATTWGDAGVCADVACSAAGACVVDMSTATGSIEQFRIMSTEADATLTIDSVVLSKSSYATVSFDTFTNVPSGDSGEGEGGDQPGDGGEGEGGDQPGDGGEGEGGEINDSEVTTTFEGWSEDSTSGDITADVDSASGAITFAGTGTYKQMFYAIPE
ncbi:MAG: hypothetical protein IKL04_06265, partial [Lachnospiraceae bacterium]|nr:hypothetical protein [Lachnospiraceae bacterium]